MTTRGATAPDAAGTPARARASAAGRRALSRSRWLAILFCGLAGVLFPAAYGIVAGIPEPVFHDEFSYLLGADTFARGRLANPSPALPEFFEAPHVLVVPTYATKYPPGQPLALAVGQVLGGQPVYGVWLSCGLFAAALCWMLQAWTTREWAIAVTMLMALTLGTTTYWAQSYWGGMIAATGSALVFGGVRRVLVRPHALDSVLLALGVLLLANSRPYEGVLVCLGPLVLLARWFFRERRVPRRMKIAACVLPAALVLGVGALAMASYNRAVTGSWQRTPYAVHLNQYFHQGIFIFNDVREPERAPAERLAKYYRENQSPPVRGIELGGQAVKNFVLRLVGTLAAPFGLDLGNAAPYYQGVLLWAVLLVAYTRRLRPAGVLGLGAAAGVAEYALSWYPPFFVPALTLLVLTPWLTTFDAVYRKSRRAPFVVACLLAVVAGQSIVLWWRPHYAAPVAALVLAAVAGTLQRVARRAPAASRTLRPVTVVAILAGIHVVALALHASGPRVRPIPSRSDLEARLERQGGSHLVFVRYDPDFPIDYDWVYNPADLDAPRVLFAHDLGESRNPDLMAVFPDRKAWLAQVSKYEMTLMPFRSQPASGPDR